MYKLYLKSEMIFSVLWIVVYILGSSFADFASNLVGFEKSFTAFFHFALTLWLILWFKKHNLFKKYGICKPTRPMSEFAFYIPLVLSLAVNLFYGFSLNLKVSEALFYIVSMICVGFLEEIIFRGFLFKAMAKDNIKTAVIISSVTFGIGHILNLFGVRGAELVPNLCQVVYAMAFGFLFVTVFIKSKSLLPCIITHSLVNGLSVLGCGKDFSYITEIIIALFLSLLALCYIIFIFQFY